MSTTKRLWLLPSLSLPIALAAVLLLAPTGTSHRASTRGLAAYVPVFHVEQRVQTADPPATTTTRPSPRPSIPVEGSVSPSKARYTPNPYTHTRPALVHAQNGSGFQACVIARESGGNPQIWGGAGGRYYGLYQFSYSTWVANGGNPADWGHASPAEQTAIFQRSSPSNWAPYDGC